MVKCIYYVPTCHYYVTVSAKIVYMNMHIKKNEI